MESEPIGGGRRRLPAPQNRIVDVENCSVADGMKLVPGDRIVSVDGHIINDVLDFHFWDGQERVSHICIERTNGVRETVELDREEHGSLGVTLEPISARRCGNRCIFCFADQNPPNVRPALRFKDEDYRLSFLRGYYVTLSNLTQKDEARITTLCLSPLYVSVHATDETIRMRLLGHRRIRPILPILTRLTAAGISIHAQIVLCPGINDGPVLKKTIEDLAVLYPGVKSVAVVPVGLTAYRSNLPAITPPSQNWCQQVLVSIQTMQRALRPRLGTRFVHAADEFFVMGNVPLPGHRAYEGFPQLGDGVGLMRHYMERLRKLSSRLPKFVTPAVDAVVATGESAHGILQNTCAVFNQVTGVALEVCQVKNQFFGPTITVAGLMTGQDILAAIPPSPDTRPVILPDVAIREQGDRFLDDWTISDLSRTAARPILVCRPTPADLWRSINGIADGRVR